VKEVANFNLHAVRPPVDRTGGAGALDRRIHYSNVAACLTPALAALRACLGEYMRRYTDCTPLAHPHLMGRALSAPLQESHLVAPGCSWLLLVAPGCSWLLLVAPGCSSPQEIPVAHPAIGGLTRERRWIPVPSSPASRGRGRC